MVKVSSPQVPEMVTVTVSPALAGFGVIDTVTVQVNAP
jgi:hypothetical protein